MPGPASHDPITELGLQASDALAFGQISLRIALLEDDDIDATVVTKQLNRAWPSGVEIDRFECLADLQAGLAQEHPDIVFCDLSVPDGRGIELLERALVAAGTIPLVVLTSAADPTLVVRALEIGAQDYLSKGEYDVELLARTLRHSLARSGADDALRQAASELTAANDHLEECLQMMAHDLRAPLRTGRLFADRLIAVTESGQDGKPIAAALNESLTRMDTMVERLLLMATLRRSRPEPGMHRLSTAAKKVELDIGPELEAVGGSMTVDTDGQVLIDLDLFGDLLGELVTNSIRYRSPERALDIRLAVETDQSSIITVRDNGVGIAAEYQDRVFRLFERLRTQSDLVAPDQRLEPESDGLGFGLARCRRIVELHHGSISLGSPPDGVGVEARIVLPIEAEAPWPDNSAAGHSIASPSADSRTTNEGERSR